MGEFDLQSDSLRAGDPGGRFERLLATIRDGAG